MADLYLTHQEELAYAEVTSVLNALMARSYAEMKQRNEAGVLTTKEFSASLIAMCDNMGDLLQRYGERLRESGMTNVADALTQWGSGYEASAAEAKSALSQDDVDLAIGLILNVSDELSKNTVVLNKIESRFGSGSGDSVKQWVSAANYVGNAYTGYEAMVDFFDGNSKSGSARLFGLVVGMAAGLFITAGAAAPIVIAITIGATVTLLGNIAESAFNGVASMFGWEDPKDAQAAVLAAIKDSNNVALTHVGNHLYWGTSGKDVFVGFDDKPNDMVGGGGGDILEGNAKADYLNGENGNDDLKGLAGDDRLKGGADDDTLNGGVGSDSLNGGIGFDTYKFSVDDFQGGATEDTIFDEDGIGKIVYNGDINISGTGIGFNTIHDSSFGTWLTSDEQFRLAVIGTGDNQTLLVTHRSSGSRIVVEHWKNGDLGIQLPDFEGVNPHNSAPLTSDNDIFGLVGNNAGNDEIDGLGGNDGLDGGAGNDVIDGGFDDDLILGGSGGDHLLGSYGNDVIIDGSELINFEDWSDTVGSDGKSQRQKIEDDIAQLGAAVVARGKGWYIRLDSAESGNGFIIVTSHTKVDLDPNVSPSGDDFIDGGEGADHISAGEGDDTIIGGVGDDMIVGGHDDDTINGGEGDDNIHGDQLDDAVPHVNFSALVSDTAQKNGNDLIDGGAGNDMVAGGGGNDIIYGGDGDDQLAGRGSALVVDADDKDRDYIVGGVGNDVIYGDDGDDTLIGGEDNDVIRGDNALSGTRHGNDTLEGGAGDDQLGGDGGDDVLRGGDGADTLIGDAVDVDGSLHGKDLLDGGVGNDTLYGFGGADTLYGGDGDDLLIGDADESQLAATYHGDDFLSGGSGNDELHGVGGNDVLDGGVGDDKLFGGAGDDVLDGGADKDELSGGGGNDRLVGDADDDELWGEAGDDVLLGGDGADTLDGGAGIDSLTGGNGADLLVGGDGTDTLDGGSGDDSLWGGAGGDHLSGGDGDDYLDGDESSVPAGAHGDDTLDGRAGNDVIHGQGGNDVITGGDGDDNLYGDDYERLFSGNDKVSGGAGNDTLLGGAGDDELTGGTGNDVLVGGVGDDTYVFERGFGSDRIYQAADEDAGHDVISFGSSITSSDLAYQIQGDDLIISAAASGDVLGIRDYFGPGSLVDIHYANGDVLTRAQLMQQLGVAEPTTGTSGDDVIKGTRFNDRLYGGAGNDIIHAKDGNDYLNGGEGDDQLYGESGSNMLEGGVGNDRYVISYGSFNTVSGLADSDSGIDVIHLSVTPSPSLMPIYQVSGDDLMVAFMTGGSQTGAVLEGFLAKTNGLHILELGDGRQLTADDFRDRECDWSGTPDADTYSGDTTSNSLDGNAGNDVLSGGGGDDYLYGDTGDDTLSGNEGNDRINGGVGVDTLYGNDGNDRMDGGAGNDTLSGNVGNDRLEGGVDDDILNGNDGNDTLMGESGDDALNGDDGDDILDGGLGKDILNGGAGNDSLHGSGVDILRGGIGDDRYYVEYIADGETANGSIEIDEGSGGGLDTVYVNIKNIAMADHVENMVILSNGGGSSICSYAGNSSDNVISVDPSAYEGGWGSQSYVIDGGLGADTLIGSGRNDTYVVDQTGDRIIESATGDGQSIDTVRASFSYALDQNSNLENIELVGGGGLTATGNSLNNTLDGTGSDGIDTLIGGGGNDLYILKFGRDGALDKVVESIDGGVDTIFVEGALGAVVRLADYSNVENIRLGEVEGALDRWYSGGSMYGNSDNNVLKGNGKANAIHGDDGNDALYGGGSESLGATDTLFGDAGDDALYAGVYGAYFYGGAGDDAIYGATSYEDHFHYFVGDSTDTIYSTAGGEADKVIFGEAIVPEMVTFSRDGKTLVVKVGDGEHDQIRIIDYWKDTEGLILSGNVGQFVFADGTIRKGGLDHLPYTNNPPVTLISQVSAEAVGDTPFSFSLPQGVFSDAADDTFVLSLAAGAPSWLSFDAATGSFTGTPPNGGQEVAVGLTATDSWGQTATASLQLNVHNVMHGTAADDSLVGTLHKDDIYAGAGNDTLDGGGNSDKLFGGAGDDLYLVNDSSVTVVELDGEGNDTINAGVNYALGDNIERLVLNEIPHAYDGTGNSADNEIVGNSLDNFLDGAGGADILVGGLGDDAYVVDQADDQIVENAGEGSDTVEASIDWQLGTELENLSLIGSDNIGGKGNASNNELAGNDGDNRLEGGAGNDRLYGGLGDDYLVLETATDKAFEGVDGGTDTIERRYETELVLNENVENLVLDSGVLKGNGNELDNTITGNADANTLGGWDGDDLLQGLAGDDSLFGGNGSDDLKGDAGNDYLDGGAGIDQMEGGAGNDTYIVDDSADVATEDANAGTDAVQTTASYTLSANIENLFLTDGAGAIDGIGNAMDNYLSGNGANNVMNGMGGSDTLAAGGGDDLLIGGAGDDKYVFDATTGSDVVDNTGGGFDGVFFGNGVDRDRLSFGQDGDDLLIFVDAATTPSVRVTNHFLGGDAAIDYVQPDGGNYLTTAQINQIVAAGGTGGQYDQVINGTVAGEQLAGSAGKDLIKGLAGDDQLFGMAGDDTLQGDDGDDYLAGGGGSGSGSGADRLEGGAGSDTLNGEDGINMLLGGAGDDSYVYGGGQDTIDNTDGGFDGVFFNDGITAAQLGFSRDGDDLLITVDDSSGNTVRVTNHFLGGDYAIDYVQPASGSMLDTAAINALVGGDGGDPGTPSEPGNDGDYSNTVEGTAAGEQLLGSNGRDLIHGLGGDDTIFGFGGDDKFDGGDGDDYLSGGNGSFSGSGNDILIGGAGVDTLVGEDGDDLLVGGVGNDKYVWQAGSGSDVIDNTGGGTDWLFFNGIDRTRLSFHRSVDDLIILVDGDSNQQVRVQDHFLGGDLAISYVQPSDGYAIPAADFGGLLTALPAGLAITDSTDSALSLVPHASVAGYGTYPSFSAGSHGDAWIGRWGWSAGYLTIDEITDALPQGHSCFGRDLDVSRQTEQLIEAMSRFHPASGEASLPHSDLILQTPALVANQNVIHRFKEFHAAPLM